MNLKDQGKLPENAERISWRWSTFAICQMANVLDDTLVYSDSGRAADRSSRIDRTGRSDHLVTALKDASSVNYGVA